MPGEIETLIASWSSGRLLEIPRQRTVLGLSAYLDTDVPAGLAGWEVTFYAANFPPVMTPAALVLLCMALLEIRKRRLRNPGCCPKCGYDLRVWTGHCPECGAADGPIQPKKGGINSTRKGTRQQE